jgi:hypothetical protein
MAALRWRYKHLRRKQRAVCEERESGIRRAGASPHDAVLHMAQTKECVACVQRTARDQRSAAGVHLRSR